MFYVSLCGLSNGTLRCYTSICDGIIFVTVVTHSTDRLGRRGHLYSQKHVWATGRPRWDHGFLSRAPSCFDEWPSKQTRFIQPSCDRISLGLDLHWLMTNGHLPCQFFIYWKTMINRVLWEYSFDGQLQFNLLANITMLNMISLPY